MQFEALIVKNDDPMVGTRVYVDADNIDQAMDEVYKQRPSDYYTAWVQAKPNLT
jgi:uncharacterized GH25 family protein